jgi:sodium/bile acid cotransporter 7
LLKRFLPDPFLGVLVVTLLLATLLPAQGWFATLVHWLTNITVVLLFFFHGAKLARSAIITGVTQWRMHLLILACTFVCFPLMALLLSWLLPDLLSPTLWTGVLFLAALPSTVQSSIAFVSIARGSIPGAVASASASQVVGVLVTPVLVSLMIGAEGESSALAGIGKIATLILLPFAVGHGLRPWIGNWVVRHKAAISLSDRATIVFAVYSVFSAAVIDGIWSSLPLSQFITLFLVCLVMLGLALLLTRTLAKLGHFKRDDEIVIVFCGTKKSMVQGVPMARVLFPGPEAGLILIPLMIFHQVQLMACAWIAKHYADSSNPVDNNDEQH